MSSNIWRKRAKSDALVLRLPPADHRGAEPGSFLVRQPGRPRRQRLQRGAQRIEGRRSGRRIPAPSRWALTAICSFTGSSPSWNACSRLCSRRNQWASCVLASRSSSAQRLPRARQARLDGPDRNAERKRDLLVAQSVHLPQHDRRPLIERQAVERVLQPRRQLLLREHPIRRRARRPTGSRRARRRADRATPDRRDDAAARTGGGCAPG